MGTNKGFNRVIRQFSRTDADSNLSCPVGGLYDEYMKVEATPETIGVVDAYEEVLQSEYREFLLLNRNKKQNDERSSTMVVVPEVDERHPASFGDEPEDQREDAKRNALDAPRGMD